MLSTCGLAILRGGDTVPQHWHTSVERMVPLTGTMQVNYDGQDPMVIQAGTY